MIRVIRVIRALIQALPALPLLPSLVCLCALSSALHSGAQEPAQPAPQAPSATAKPLTVRPASSPLDPEALRISKLPLINGVPYDQPSTHDLALDYVRDSYGLPAIARTTVRALYSEGRDKPDGWGQDFPGFMQRFGSAAAVTAINGNVRFAMELAFHEDLRYLPCTAAPTSTRLRTPCSPRSPRATEKTDIASSPLPPPLPTSPVPSSPTPSGTLARRRAHAPASLPPASPLPPALAPTSSTSSSSTSAKPGKKPNSDPPRPRYKLDP